MFRGAIQRNFELIEAIFWKDGVSVEEVVDK